MPKSSITALAALLFVSSVAIGCMPQQTAPPASSAGVSPAGSTPTTAASPPRSERHFYRFDFVVTANDGSAAPSSTSFTLNLQEGDKGEMTVGKNVPISPAPTSGSSTGAAPRQDVGVKVVAVFHSMGDDVLLDVAVEMSTFDPPSTIRKVVAKGNALASPGKPALVTTLEDDHKRYQLMVTPTKLR